MRLWPFGKKNKPAEPSEKIVKRYYHGATLGPLYADFRASLLSADSELNVALSTLRSRARDLERNNAHARRFLQLMQDNIVGHVGFNLQVAARNTTGKLDERGNREIKDAWTRYCKVVTADGKMSMTETMRMCARIRARDGEVFLQEVQGRRFQDGIAWHFVEADQVDETLNQVYKPTGNQIRMGVEVDKYGRVAAYHVLTTHPGDYTWVSPVTRDKYIRIPAEKMIHFFEKRRPGQTRGEPPMAPVMNDIKMLGGYRESEITHRRAAASKMGFFERAENAGPSSGIADSEGEDGQLEMEVSPGKMSVLPEGYKFNSFDANSTHTDYAAFEKQIIRSIAAGLGPSYFDLAMDLDDVSYSSIRQGALADRDFYRGHQRFHIDSIQRPIYERWLRLNMGGMNDMINLPVKRLDKFLNASKFIPRGWDWVDPQKEVKAAIMAEDAGYTSKTAIVAEKGSDFRQVIEDKESEQQVIQDSDLDLESDET